MIRRFFQDQIHSMTELSDTDSENEENQLPEGTFAVALSKATQEKFEVVANWHLSELEPQKEIPLEVLQADVESRKQARILKNWKEVKKVEIWIFEIELKLLYIVTTYAMLQEEINLFSVTSFLYKWHTKQ